MLRENDNGKWKMDLRRGILERRLKLVRGWGEIRGFREMCGVEEREALREMKKRRMAVPKKWKF